MPEHGDRTTPADFAYAHRGSYPAHRACRPVHGGDRQQHRRHRASHHHERLPRPSRPVPVDRDRLYHHDHRDRPHLRHAFPGTGQVPALHFGLLLFVAAPLPAGLPARFPLLIAARIVQGIGAAMLMSISMAIIMQVFPLHERGKALGIRDGDHRPWPHHRAGARGHPRRSIWLAVYLLCQCPHRPCPARPRPSATSGSGDTGGSIPGSTGPASCCSSC